MIFGYDRYIPEAILIETKKRWDKLDRISLEDYKLKSLKIMHWFTDEEDIENSYANYLKGEEVRVDVPDKIENILKEVTEEANKMIKF